MFRKGFTAGAGFGTALLCTALVYAAATYPGGVASLPVRSDGQTITAAWFNTIHDEIVAIEGGLINGLAHDLKFTDATYDIGKSGATRPRDGFFSRNMVVGGTLGVTGVATFTAAPVFSAGVASLALSSDAATSDPTARTIYRDSMVSAWVRVTNSGIPTIADDYNVDSLTDNGVGDTTVTLDTAVASANYACTASVLWSTAGAGNTTEARIISISTTAVRVLTQDAQSGAAEDRDFSLMCVGE